MGASRGPEATVEFLSGGVMMQAVIPADQLWVAIKDILVYEDYEFLSSFRLSRLPPRATVLDAGAFVGLFSLKASPYAHRVVSLEPNAESFRMLESNIRRNRVANIDVRPIALHSADGYSRFSESGTISHLKKDGGSTVRTMTLDAIVEEVGHVHMLKMDIEGSEYEVFGASKSALSQVDRIAAEVHVYEQAHAVGLRSLLETLGSRGFKPLLLPSPFQGVGYGLAKPWNCPLKRYNQGNAFLYRFLLSAIYGAYPLARALRPSLDTGFIGLLLAEKSD